ncbi:MAG: B12-binding domain-containing protein [Rhodospirillales bacterium]
MRPSACGAVPRRHDRVDTLVDEAVDWVTARIAAKHADRPAIAGTLGRLPTDAEVREQVTMLAVAAASPAAEAFRDYVRWLAVVLTSRGAPGQTLGETLTLLRAFFERRLEPSARAPVVEMLRSALDALAEEHDRGTPGDHGQGADGLPGVEPLTRGLLAGDIARVRSIAMEAFAAEWDYIGIATRLFQPALYRIGLLWQHNEITVAAEHLATAISRNVLAQLYPSAEFAPPTGRRALFAAVAGNEHSLGPRMVSDAFELAGWSVQYLGANTPTDALVAQIEAWRPELVGLSVSLVRQLTDLKDAVAAIGARFGERRPKVMVGGLPINQIDGIWRWSGADLWSPGADAAVPAAVAA